MASVWLYASIVSTTCLPLLFVKKLSVYFMLFSYSGSPLL